MTGSPDYQKTLDRLDEFFEAAYFVPLSVNDALAVQFQNPALKGLPINTIRDVFHLVDRIKDELGSDPSETDAAALFYQRLQQELPEVFETWLQGDPNLRLDPGAAILNAEIQSKDAINLLLKGNYSELEAGLLAETIESAVKEIIRGLDVGETTSDRDIRHMLRAGMLEKYPPWARPSIYLEIWSRFARTVTDLDPDPDLKAIWPY